MVLIAIKVLTIVCLAYFVKKVIEINPSYKWHVGLALIFIYQLLNNLGYSEYDEYIRPVSSIIGTFFFIKLLTDIKK